MDSDEENQAEGDAGGDDGGGRLSTLADELLLAIDGAAEAYRQQRKDATESVARAAFAEAIRLQSADLVLAAERDDRSDEAAGLEFDLAADDFSAQIAKARSAAESLAQPPEEEDEEDTDGGGDVDDDTDLDEDGDEPDEDEAEEDAGADDAENSDDDRDAAADADVDAEEEGSGKG